MTTGPIPVPGTGLVAELAATGTTPAVWCGAGAMVVGGVLVLVLARHQMRR